MWAEGECSKISESVSIVEKESDYVKSSVSSDIKSLKKVLRGSMTYCQRY